MDAIKLNNDSKVCLHYSVERVDEVDSMRHGITSIELDTIHLKQWSKHMDAICFVIVRHIFYMSHIFRISKGPSRDQCDVMGVVAGATIR